MLTICWAAKGGSGTTVVTAIRALGSSSPVLLVDLAGDLPLALGIDRPDGPGVGEWLGSNAPAGRLGALEVRVREGLAIIPAGERPDGPSAGDRWLALAAHLAADRRDVLVDAGTRPPPPALLAACDRAWLVTRPCYLALRAAASSPVRPTGVVLVDEPGRALRPVDVEAAIGAPVVATVLLDPAVARAVDAGLLVGRVPAACRRVLGAAA